jgi:hypothetical protein
LIFASENVFDNATTKQNEHGELTISPNHSQTITVELDFDAYALAKKLVNALAGQKAFFHI